MTGPVYWDGYGLSAATSGVYVHAQQLASELLQLGTKPLVVLPAGACSQFAGLETTTLAKGMLGRRLGQIKPVWPERVGRKVSQLRSSDHSPYILHGLSNFNIPIWHRDRYRRTVLTVHDLIPFLAPTGVSYALRRQLLWLLPRALRRADRVICVSHWTRATLVERYPWVADRCVVIPNGIPSAPALKQQPSAPGQWTELLYVARFEPYKQHQFLIEILKSSRQPLRLTIVTDHNGRETCAAAAPELVKAGRLRFFGDLSLEAVAALHEQSDVYVSPSLYEGYGLPAASSLVAGKPVVYLSGSGIDEVVGRQVGVAMSRTDDAHAWDGGIARALAMKRLPGYESDLVAHLATLATWKDAARALQALYNELT